MYQNKSNSSFLIEVYNEEKNIVICINSIIWADKIIVIDTNSNDNSRLNAKKFTKYIYIFKKINYVEEVRNYGLQQVKTDWVFVLDADETLPPGAEKIIRKLIQDKTVDGYWFPRRAYISKTNYLKHGYFYPDYQLRLFRANKNIRYSGVIHEQPMIPKEKVKYINELEIYHNTSHCKYDAWIHFFRMVPYISIEGKELAKSNTPTWKFLYLIPLDFIRHIWRSFIKLEGYKDGYPGLRAAVIFSKYKTCVNIYALFCRITHT
jgi:glycosyltransferase involved in cell wall biosynthesis